MRTVFNKTRGLKKTVQSSREGENEGLE